jgi:hypothetical protein
MGASARRQRPVVSRGDARPSSRKSAGPAIARTLRTRWWPRAALAGALLAVVGITVLSGVAEAAVALFGAFVFLIALLKGLGADDIREPPVPPGSGSAGLH